jgi:hypothetical protein
MEFGVIRDERRMNESIDQQELSQPLGEMLVFYDELIERFLSLTEEDVRKMEYDPFLYIWKLGQRDPGRAQQALVNDSPHKFLVVLDMWVQQILQERQQRTSNG